MTPHPRPATASSGVPAGTVLAFDFGLKRIGVAVGETVLRQAHPLVTIEAEANAERFGAIAALIAEWQPVRLVVGLPLTLDGGEHELTARCRRFAHQLEGRFRLPVDLADERLTSIEAESRLRETGTNPRKRKAEVDALAAQIILQAYFDATS